MGEMRNIYLSFAFVVSIFIAIKIYDAIVLFNDCLDKSGIRILIEIATLKFMIDSIDNISDDFSYSN